ESMSTPLQEPQMAAELRRDQRQIGIAAEGRVVEDFERDERVVLGLDDEGGHADLVEKRLRRLRLVISIGGPKPEGRGGNDVVYGVDGFRVTELIGSITPGGDQPLVHAFDEAPLIQDVVTLVDAARTGAQIDGNGNRTY